MRSIEHWTPNYISSRPLVKIDHKLHPANPWLTRGAVRLLAQLLRPDDVAPGIRFWPQHIMVRAAREKKLASVEHDAAWHERGVQLLSREKIENVDLLHRSLDVPEAEGEKAAYVRVLDGIPDASVGFCLIDGVYRGYCALGTLAKMKTGGCRMVSARSIKLPRCAFAQRRTHRRHMASVREGDAPDMDHKQRLGHAAALQALKQRNISLVADIDPIRTPYSAMNDGVPDVGAILLRTTLGECPGDEGTGMLALRLSLHLLLNHPLTRGRPLFAFLCVAKWQIASRMFSNGIVVDFIGPTRLLVRRGMRGATGNIYYGLWEFLDMGFVIHFLRKGDVFADVGANIGSFSILASGVAGARSFAYEPTPATMRHLEDNIFLNRLGDLITIRPVALGSTPGVVRFTQNLDTANHVALEGDSLSSSFECPVVRLDDDFEDDMPILLKVDVEGFETEVLAGARRILASPRTQAVIIELNGQSRNYGRADEDVRVMLRDNGFLHVVYDPLTRALRTPGDGAASQDVFINNEIWVKDVEFVAKRLRDAPTIAVLGREV